MQCTHPRWPCNLINLQKCFLLNIPNFSGVRRGLGGVQTPSPNRKNCCRKMLFPKVLFWATTFPKNRLKYLIFRLNYHQKFSKFSQNFPNHQFFLANARKFNAGFINFLKKRLKECNFFNCLAKRWFCGNFL